MDLDGISILEDTPLPKPTEKYKSTFDNILKNLNIAIEPSVSCMSICNESVITIGD